MKTVQKDSEPHVLGESCLGVILSTSYISLNSIWKLGICWDPFCFDQVSMFPLKFSPSLTMIKKARVFVPCNFFRVGIMHQR
jgi:hypothetical protein